MVQGQGDAVRHARQAARMIQVHLAQAACVSLSTVKRAERGESVSDDNLRAVCAVLSLDVTALPRPTSGRPESDLLAGEFVDLDEAGRAALADLGPVLAAGRCQADLWLSQGGRPAAISAREMRSFRGSVVLAASLVTFVSGMLFLALYHGGWVHLLGHEMSTGIAAAAAVPTLASLTVFSIFLHGLFRAERDERVLAEAMSFAIGRVAAATPTAFVGFVETDGVAALDVIPWSSARASVTVEGAAATLSVEGSGCRFQVEGLPSAGSLVEEVRRRAARVDSQASETCRPAQRRMPNPWRIRDVEYLTRLAPGFTRSRRDGVITVRGPGREALATLSLREDGVSVLSGEPLDLITGSRSKTYRIAPGTPAWIPLRLGQAFSVVRGEAGDPRRLAQGWAEATPGFVLSGRHVIDGRAAPMEIALRHLGAMAVYPAAALAIAAVLLPVLMRFDLTIGERATRAFQAQGMSYKEAIKASSPTLGLFRTSAASEATR